MLKNTSNPVILGLFLGIIGGAAAILLAKMADVTREPIKKNQQKIITGALESVLPRFDNTPGDNTLEVKAFDAPNINVKFFGATENGKLTGVAGQTISLKGYSGEIQVMVGLDLDGKVRTVLVTKQNETPGLGTVVCERKQEVTIFELFSSKKDNAPKLPPNRILDAFAGHSASPKDSWPQPWKVEKDGGKAEFMTGATITSRAVTDAVYRVAKTYMQNKSQIVAALSKNKAEKAK